MLNIKQIVLMGALAFAACGPKAGSVPTSAATPVVIDVITPLSQPTNPCASRPQVVKCGVPSTEQK